MAVRFPDSRTRRLLRELVCGRVVADNGANQGVDAERDRVVARRVTIREGYEGDADTAVGLSTESVSEFVKCEKIGAERADCSNARPTARDRSAAIASSHIAAHRSSGRQRAKSRLDRTHRRRMVSEPSHRSPGPRRG
jgi:hypothetical protein